MLAFNAQNGSLQVEDSFIMQRTVTQETLKEKKKKKKKEHRSHEHLGSKVWQDVTSGTRWGLCIPKRGKMNVSRQGKAMNFRLTL